MRNKLQLRLRKTILFFGLLLLYVIAALVWWFISLEKQNKKMYHSGLQQLNMIVNKSATPSLYDKELNKLQEEYHRNQVKYAGEGIVFLGLIIVGAAVMFRSLRRQIIMQQQQQNFMMAVTHELKTPIAIAKLNLETLLKHKLDEQKQTKLLTMTLDETKRLNFLTNNILISSQLEDSRHTVTKEELDFSDLLKAKVAEFTNRINDRQFICEIEEDTDINADPLLLEILVNNLIENAVKYSDKNSRITVRLQKKDVSIILQVIDEGQGIPDSEKKKIFSKFYRIGDEATRTQKGTGLGLYLCKLIADDHSADISVSDNIPKGSIFAVNFKA